MENSHETSNGHGPTDNGHMTPLRRTLYQPGINPALSWLDIKVFYVRISKCEVDDLTPENLTLNHIPLNHDTLLEVNGVRTGIYSDGVSTILRRDRLDKKSEEVIFVSTDSIRMTNSVKFEVFDRDALVLSGVLELCSTNGFIQEPRNFVHGWSLTCETDITMGSGFFRGRQLMGPDSGSPTIEVYVAGSFSGTPIILTKTLQIGFRKKHSRNGMLDTIPEYESTESQEDVASTHPLQMEDYPYSDHKPECEEYGHHMYSGSEYLEGEDGELSWFNAGVRVGVGIGLSVCIGVGLGVGLLIRTYQGTTRTFRRRLL